MRRYYRLHTVGNVDRLAICTYPTALQSRVDLDVDVQSCGPVKGAAVQTGALFERRSHGFAALFQFGCNVGRADLRGIGIDISDAFEMDELQ